ncbi:MAG: hypothetical protein M0R28_07040 [Pigmentiphaga sp.]|nr:hypothetical protein [Pigmentiphaga sp.]
MWRAIVIFLAVLWTMSAFAGVWLGQALSDSAPLRTDNLPNASLQAAAGNVGQGIPAAPQPRVDGSFGVPERGVGDLVAEVSLVSAMENTASSVSMTTVVVEPRQRSEDPARILAGLDGAAPRGPANEADLVVPGLNAMAGDLPPGLAHAPAVPPPPPPTPRNDWLQQLRNGLQACGGQQRYSAAECEQRLRQQFCTPNDGWGVVAECPGYLRNLRL